MKLLKHILLTLLVCLTFGCSGSKMEPINEDPFLESGEDGRLSLDGDDSDKRLSLDSDGSGGNQGERLRLADDIPAPPPAAAKPQAAAANPAERSVAGSGCPTPTCPPAVQANPCQPNCPQPQSQAQPQGQPQAQSPIQTQPHLVGPCTTPQGGLSPGMPYSEFVPKETKIVFVVDKGMHNRLPTPYASEGNDRYGATRIHHIRQFFEDHKDHGWFSWSVITFVGRLRGWEGDATAYISRDDDGHQPFFTKDHNVVMQAIDKLSPSVTPDGSEEEGVDSGKIQYGAALELTKKLIKDDLREQTDDVYYQVFFISGMSPTDAQHERWPFEDYDHRILNEIVNIKPGRVFFFTAYYGWHHEGQHRLGHGGRNPDFPTVIEILEEMANIGGNDELIYLTNIAGQPSLYSQSNIGTQQVHPCQQTAATNPCDTTVPVMGGIDPNAPTLLHLPDGYLNQEEAARSHLTPCDLATVLPCGHSVAQHAQGVQCADR